MTLQNKQRIYFLEMRVHDLEAQIKQIKRAMVDFIDVVEVVEKH